MAFKKAERTQLYLRCALFGPSGSGKTMTALLMAKGIADTMGVPFAVIDTEARSASKYSDRISFDVNDLGKKTVDDYITAMNEAIKAGYKVLVIDSLSHAWRELTDEVDRIAQNSASKNTFSPWAKVNPKQKQFIDAILNFPGHIIATMRSNTEWVIGERKDGKSVPEKVGLKPEQGKGIEFEFDLLMELDQKHQATVTKDRTGKFQDESIDKPGEAFGVALYDWLSSGTVVPVPETKPAKTGKAKTEPPKAVPAKTPLTEPPIAGSVKEKGKKIVDEIGVIITANSESGNPYFTEMEKGESRKIIESIHSDEAGIKDLEDLKTFLNDELSKRKAANEPKTAIPASVPAATQAA
ncbi:ATP-binding protein [Treponema primitia]|uniref:ATP-binding protein n=1 Tax=Treponema primitia TaxID=88058 RepID=UPI0002554E58|nr:ATP-binding protein [Treponema primitia]